MRQIILIALIGTLVFLSACSPPPPPPTYSLFLDEGLIVYEYSGRYTNHTSVPNDAREAYVGGRTEEFLKYPGDPLGDAHFALFVYEWNGSIPNVGLDEPAILSVAGVDGPVRIPGGPIVTDVRERDFERITDEVYLSSMTSIGSVEAGPVAIQRGDSVRSLIKPSEYLLLLIWFAIFTGFIGAAYLFGRWAAEKPISRVPLISGSIAALGGLIVLMIFIPAVNTTFTSPLLSSVLQITLFYTVAGSLVAGQVETLRRHGVKQGLITFVLSLAFLPAASVSLYMFYNVILFAALLIGSSVTSFL